MIKNYYYLGPNQQPVGPLQLAVLRQLRESGVVQDSTLAAAEGDIEWNSVAEIIAVQPPPVPTRPRPPSAASPLIVRREMVIVMLLFIVTLGLYGIYLVADYSRSIGGITGRKKLPFAAVIILSIVTLTIFTSVYHILLSYELQRHSESIGTAGRSANLGTNVLTLAIVDVILTFVSGGVAFFFMVALTGWGLWLLQQEVNLYATMDL